MENISMDSLLKSLREQYQSGDFDKVKDSLLENKSAFDKGDFHYNLGTVYSKMGNYAVGRYHLEKAIFEGHDSVASKHNLKNVEQMLAIHDLSTSKSADDVILSKSLSYSSDFYVFLSLFLLVIGLVLFMKKIFTRGALTFFVLLSFVPIGAKFFWLDKFNVGILFSEAQVYEGPSAIFEKTGKIPSGAKVVLGKSTEGWFFVERPVDYVGWIKSKDVGVLK